MSRYFLSCDWGTSNFRLRLVEIASMEVRGELRSGDGIDRLEGTGPERFSAYLALRIEDLLRGKEVEGEVEATATPLWISGMASSTIGGKEIPYASLPFPLDGSGARVADLGALEGSRPHPVHLVSGLRSDDDILRGEETEALGLLSLLDGKDARDTREETLLIFPGTHSKHLSARGGKITDFRTFMTGELYNVLCCHSILRRSVEEIQTLEGIEEPFLEGVRRTAAQGMSAGLFRTRTRQVLDKKPAVENGAYLSGLLLATELISVARSPGRILVGARGLMAALYLAAAKELGIARVETASATQLELSVPAGHALIQSARNESS